MPKNFVDDTLPICLPLIDTTGFTCNSLPFGGRNKKPHALYQSHENLTQHGVKFQQERTLSHLI